MTTDEQPDLIDAEGVRWRWVTRDPEQYDFDPSGYACAELFCRYSRDDVERHFGPVREVSS